MIFNVIAYRWGWLNSHHYLIACTTDQDEASRIAQEESDFRGGKYGVAVMQWKSSMESEMVSYFSSSWCEPAPYWNEKIDMFNSLGHDLHGVVTTGLKWQSDEGSPAVSRPVAVDVPSWGVESVRTREELCRLMTAVRIDAQARSAPASEGCSTRSEAELAEWIKETSQKIKREVNEMLISTNQKRDESLSRYEARSNIEKSPGARSA